MTVQAKIPASRSGGAGAGAGPIAAPRVVGNRRLRAGGIALAIMLGALGMALSAIALISATRTHAYLAMKHDVPIGQKITADDLTTVQLSGGAGLSAVPANQINTVVGRFSTTNLIHGTLLSPDELSQTSVLSGAQAQVGVSVKGANMPAQALKPNDKIWLVAGSSAAVAATGGVPKFDATVVSSSAPASDGTVTLYLAVAPGDAPLIVNLNLNGGLGVVLRPAGS